MRPDDTTDEAWQVRLRILRRMTPAERVLLAMEMSDEIREVAAAGTRRRHPDWTVMQVRREVARLAAEAGRSAG